MLSVRSLGSGSSGNAILIEMADQIVAVDCGVGPRALRAGLRAAGKNLSDLSAVLLTHEHTDHVRALPKVISEKIPIVSTPGTARAARLPASAWTAVRPGVPLAVGAFEVTALSVSHDAAEPCGFYLRGDGTSLTILTDLGASDESLHPYLAASDFIVLEANHDVDMLRLGPYPAYLKRRVLSAHGHLSNADCGRLLAAALALDRRPRTIWLAHLSTTNNRPELAKSTVDAAVAPLGGHSIVMPLARYGHDQVWRPKAQVPPAAQLGFEFRESS